MKKIILIILLLLSMACLQAQYVWFEGNNLNSTVSLNVNKLIAVGGGLESYHKLSSILKSTDGGSNWQLQTKNAILYSVCFSDINNGTAVGDAGTILRTTNGGEDWVSQTSGVSNTLYGVSFTDVNTGTAVGTSGKIIRTTNGGNDWFVQPIGTSAWFYGVSFVDINNGWIVGSNSKIFRTSNGGNIWVSQTSGSNQILYGISFADLNNGIICGANGTIIKTTDGGNNWIAQTSGTTNHLYGISFVNNNWTAVGEWGTIIRNGIVQTSGTTNRLNGICFSDDNNGTAIGCFGTIVKTTNGGNEWVNKLCTQMDSYHFIYNGLDRFYYVFVPYNYYSLSNLPIMIGLCGSGQTGQIFQDFSRMCAVANTSGFIAVYPSPIDGNWHYVNDVGFISAVIDSVNSDYSIDLSRVYVCGMSRGGWMSHEIGCQLSDRIAAIGPVAGTILQTTISNCSTTASPPVVYLHGTLDDLVPYSGVEQTLNFWIERNNANVIVDSVALPDIDTTDGSTVMKYSFRNSSGIARVVFFKIINGGHSWPGWTWGVGSGPYLATMDINASQEIWNFVKNFTKTPIGISDNLKLIPGNFSLFQNHPNPFNPTTTIGFGIMEKGNVRLSILNILGEEIKVY